MGVEMKTTLFVLITIFGAALPTAGLIAGVTDTSPKPEDPRAKFYKQPARFNPPSPREGKPAAWFLK
ncbi:unnamed protein product, partial [marine sediment metagenome]